mmetsp:Transcript_35994/g.64702  ORF Transcript_35994/g.64702 Transcript_35994/m.64702 type:complete len:204 (-) Transcript_35994:8-619(-)
MRLVSLVLAWLLHTDSGRRLLASVQSQVGFNTDERNVLSAPKVPPPTAPQPPQLDGLGRIPTEAEMVPASPEMLARAAQSLSKWEERVLTPDEAVAFLGDGDDVQIIDVRTQAQRCGHTISGRSAVSIKGALSLPLDDIVSGTLELPPSNASFILVCSRGPKSLVALDYLAGHYPKAVCVQGGIEAWYEAGLPTEDVSGSDQG